jgi:methionyl aminopeptidase
MTITSEEDLVGLKRAGRIVSLALSAMKRSLERGMTTADLDGIGERVFARHGAQSAPQIVYGFPGATCISINDEAVHGIPGPRILQAGDLVKIDVTAELDGYIADAAISVAVPPASKLSRAIAECAEAAFWRGARSARVGRPRNGIGHAVEKAVRDRGFNVLAELAGHGVGRSIHEPPTIPNYYDAHLTESLPCGLVITIEPIVSSGSSRVVAARDGWTLATADGSLSAHYEHTVVITRGQPLVLTAA